MLLDTKHTTCGYYLQKTNIISTTHRHTLNLIRRLVSSPIPRLDTPNPISLSLLGRSQQPYRHDASLTTIKEVFQQQLLHILRLLFRLRALQLPVTQQYGEARRQHPGNPLHEMCSLHRNDNYRHAGHVRNGHSRDWYLLLQQVREGHWVQVKEETKVA